MAIFDVREPQKLFHFVYACEMYYVLLGSTLGIHFSGHSDGLSLP